MLIKYLFSLSFMLLSVLTFGQNFTGGFSFSLPTTDSSTQAWLPKFPKYTITEPHRVSTGADGTFRVQGQPIRFWGVNIGAAACFPPKSEAPAIAARMRKMGINLVRFHHLENTWTSLQIFDYNQGTRQLYAPTLDRLEYFIAQLKENGIYVNMNLNVSRIFKASDGVLHADSLVEFAKGVTYFDPWLRFLQKEYAEQLLGHINPYTGMSLASDPVLAMVEMNNENTMHGFWKDGVLRVFAEGGFLIHRHDSMLTAQYNAWLLAKYGTQAALETAWALPPSAGSTNQIINAGFETSTTPWQLELHSGAAATIGQSTTAPHTGSASGQLQTSVVTGTDWHVQLKQTGMSMLADSVYEVRFWARGAVAQPIFIALMRDNAPYTFYDGRNLNITTNWREYSFQMSAPEDNSGAVRLTISPQQVGTIYFDDFHFGAPIFTPLGATELLSNGSVQRTLYNQRFSYPAARVNDEMAFYLQVMDNHNMDLRNHLRNQIGVTSPITGTNALTGVQDAWTQRNLDYIDDHSYWDHPQFPNQPWSSTDWLINNTSQIASTDPSSIKDMTAGIQIAGKPYTISEYNHGAPNRFRSEMPHLLAAYSGYHGVDGIMFYDYFSGENWNVEAVDGYFSLYRDHSVTGQFPTFAWAYRAGKIHEATDPVTINYSTDWVNQSWNTDFIGRWQKFVPYSKYIGLTKSARLSFDQAPVTDFGALAIDETGPFTTSNSESVLDSGNGLLRTSVPGMSALSGNLAQNAGAESGPLTLVSADFFGSVSLISLTTDALNQTDSAFLTIATTQQNTGTNWNGTFTVNNQWGSAPVVHRAGTLSFQLNHSADTLILHRLNALGQAVASQTILPTSAGMFTVNINQASQPSMWFGIEARRTASSTQTLPQVTNLVITPNPTCAGTLANFQVSETIHLVGTLYHAGGSAVRQVFNETFSAGSQSRLVNMDGLPAGNYQLIISSGGRSVSQQVLATRIYGTAKILKL